MITAMKSFVSVVRELEMFSPNSSFRWCSVLYQSPTLRVLMAQLIALIDVCHSCCSPIVCVLEVYATYLKIIRFQRPTSTIWIRIAKPQGRGIMFHALVWQNTYSLHRFLLLSCHWQTYCISGCRCRAIAPPLKRDSAIHQGCQSNTSAWLIFHNKSLLVGFSLRWHKMPHPYWKRTATASWLSCRRWNFFCLLSSHPFLHDR